MRWKINGELAENGGNASHTHTYVSTLLITGTGMYKNGNF